MKKLFALTLCAMVVAGCDDSTPAPKTTEPAKTETTQAAQKTTQPVVEQKAEQQIKAHQPESQIEKPFTKTESGRVIFKNVTDLFEEEALYSPEDKDIIVQSESPLKLTLKESVLETIQPQYIREELESKFIYNIFTIFAHTDVNQVEMTLDPIKQNGKPYDRKMVIKGKVTRERALQVLQTYSSMKSFDDYVSFDTNDEYITLGFSRSQRGGKFSNGEYRNQIFNALITGKMEAPFEMVKLPIDVDFTNIQVKLKKAFDLSIFQNDSRKLANGDQEYSTAISDFVKVYAIGKDQDHIVQVAVQFAFVNDPDIVLQSTGAIAAAMLATPNPDKSFKTVTSMMEAASKKMKKSKNKDKVEEVRLVDGLTLKLTVHPSLGGIAFLTIEKLEKQPKRFE